VRRAIAAAAAQPRSADWPPDRPQSAAGVGHAAGSLARRRTRRPAVRRERRLPPCGHDCLHRADATEWPGRPVATWPLATPGNTFQPPRGRGIQRFGPQAPLTAWLPIRTGLTPHRGHAAASAQARCSGSRTRLGSVLEVVGDAQGRAPQKVSAASPMMRAEVSVEDFELHRRRLFSIAYRMLGSAIGGRGRCPGLVPAAGVCRRGSGPRRLPGPGGHSAVLGPPRLGQDAPRGVRGAVAAGARPHRRSGDRPR